VTIDHQPDPAATERVLDGVSVGRLDAAYAGGEDPWRIATGFYERRKRQVLLGCLPHERYRSGFEPGCAGGELTALLAQRCDELLAADYHQAAVARTAARMAGVAHCSVEQRLLPSQWPSGRRFDLVVIAEFGYYLSEPAWIELCAHIAGSLTPDATVLACHWRHHFDGRTLATDVLHARLGSALGSAACTTLIDDDFSIEVWSGAPGTVAERDGRR
jgi:hypothetical protein